MVALSGAYVRRLGGSLRLQALALLIALTAPYFLGANWVFQTVTFDEATWMVALYWFLCPRPRCPAPLLDRPRPHAGHRSGGEVHDPRPHRGDGPRRPRHPAAARVAANPLPLDRRHDRAAHLGAQPRLARRRGLPHPALHRQPSRRRRWAGRQRHSDRRLPLLPAPALDGRTWYRCSAVRSCGRLGIACLLPLVLFLVVGKSYYAIGTVPLVLAQGLMAARPRQATAARRAPPDRRCARRCARVPRLPAAHPPDHSSRIAFMPPGWTRRTSSSRTASAGTDIAHQVQTLYGDPSAERARAHDYHLGLLRRAGSTPCLRRSNSACRRWSARSSATTTGCPSISRPPTR